MVESKTDDSPQDSQLTKNQASRTMTPISGEVSSGKFPPLLLNARYILKKIKSIRLLTLSSNLEFTLITETWLNNHTPDNDLIIPSCKSIRKIHESQSEYGYLVHAEESIPATLCQDTMLNTIQYYVWAGAEMDNEVLLFGCIYRPPISCQNDF